MEAIIDRLNLYDKGKRASLLKILGIFLIIALAYLLVAFSVKWTVAMVFVLLFGLFLFIDIKTSLFLLIILRINLDAFHQVLNIPLGEYRTLSLPSLLGMLIFFVGVCYLLAQKIRFWKIPVVRSFVFFFSACLLPLLFSKTSLNTLAEIVELGSFIVLYMVTIDILKQEKDIKRMVNFMILSSFIPLVAGFIQLFHQTDIRQVLGYELSFRLWSTTPHPNVYAMYLVMLSILVTSILLQERSSLKKKGLFLLLALLLSSLIFTYMRGAWIGLILAMLVLGILKHRKLLFLAPLGVVLAIHIFPSILQRFAPIFDPNSFQYTSLGWRIRMWMLSFNYFLQNPVFGLGFGNYIFVYHKMMELYMAAHNDYLRILVETGMVGFSCFIWMLWSLLKMGIKAYQKWDNSYYQHICLGFLALWVAYVVMSIADNYFNQGTIQWYFWTYAALVTRIYMIKPGELSNARGKIE